MYTCYWHKKSNAAVSGFMHNSQLLEYRKTNNYSRMLVQGGLTELGHWKWKWQERKRERREAAGNNAAIVRGLGAHYLTISITDYGLEKLLAS